MAKRVDGDPKKDIKIKQWIELTKQLFENDQNTLKNASLKYCKEVTELSGRLNSEANKWSFVKLEQKIGGVKRKNRSSKKGFWE